MDLNMVIEIIKGVGFPIAMCIALFYYMVKQNDKHETETQELRNTVQANTQVLTELCTLIKTLVK